MPRRACRAPPDTMPSTGASNERLSFQVGGGVTPRRAPKKQRKDVVTDESLEPPHPPLPLLSVTHGEDQGHRYSAVWSVGRHSNNNNTEEYRSSVYWVGTGSLGTSDLNQQERERQLLWRHEMRQETVTWSGCRSREQESLGFLQGGGGRVIEVGADAAQFQLCIAVALHMHRREEWFQLVYLVVQFKEGQQWQRARRGGS